MKKSLLLTLLLAFLLPWALQAEILTFDFEDGQIPAGWTTDATYPWISATEDPDQTPINCIKSSNSGVGSSSSTISATFTFAGDGSISFRGGCWGEGTSSVWDKCIFSIDGSSKFANGALQSWNEYSYNLEAGEHTFTWTFSKDGSVNAAGDAFYIDDVVVDLGVASACPKPTGLNIEASGVNATLSWTSDASAFSIVHATEVSANPESLSAQSSTDNSLLFEDLALGDHYFWVKADCGADGASGWAGPATVHVGYCQPAPTSVDGNGITAISFGSGDNVVNNSGTKLPVSAPFYGDYSAQIGAVAASLTATVDITFSTGYTYGTIIWVDWNKSLSFEDNEIVYAGESSSGNPTTLNATFDIPASQALGDYRMRIAAADSYYDSHKTLATAAGAEPCPTGTYTVVHDYTLRVLEAPSCMPVSGLSASNIQAHSAVLDWTAGQSESAWKLYYKKTAEEDWSAAINVNALPYTLENLDAATAYQFKVVAVCSDSDESDASAVASFNTGYAAPFEEKFNASSAPANWAIYSGLLAGVMSGDAELTSASGWSFGTSNNVFDSHARANIYGTSCNKWLVTPAIEVGENMQLSFDLALTVFSSSSSASPAAGEQDDDKFVVLISTDNKQSWSVLRQWDNAGSEYVFDAITNAAEGQFVNIDLSEYAGQGVVIAFYGESTLEGGDNNLHIDNVAIKEIPSCMKPTDLAVDNIGAHLAQLRWSANSGESAWKLFVKKASEADFAEAVVVEENPYILESLDAATTYQFKVVAVCGEENESEESSVASFTTDCEALTIDADHSYQMNFDALTVASSYTAPSSRVLPVCWNAINTTTYSSNQVFPTAYYYSYTNYANSAPNSLKFYSSYSSYGSYDPQPQYAILPEMEGLDGKQISLSARGYNASSEIKIGRMSNPADASTFVPFATQALTTSYQEFEFIIPSGEGNYLVIMIEAANSSRTTNGAYIDDIVVSVAPTCAKPKNPARNYSSIKAHSVELSWTAGDESQTAWEIALSKRSSFNPDETDSIVAVTSNPATINQYLDQSTTYYAYVRANCGSEDGKSLWSSSYVSFTTISGHQMLNSLALVDGSLGSASAKVNWKSNAANERHSSYEVYISQQNTLPATEEELSSDGLILNIEDTFYVFSDLQPETQYYVWVRDNCAEDGLSNWSSRATFTTTANCPIPAGISASEIAAHTADIAWTIGEADGYTVQYRTAAGIKDVVLNEAFASSSIPTTWTRSTGLVDDVVAGTVELSSNTAWTTNSYALGAYNARLNIYGSSVKHWLISPESVLAGDAVLNFDLALTKYNSSSAADGTCDDDRFAVVIFADNAWSILREWNNSGSEHVYNNIPISGVNVSIDLSAYEGKSIKIGFYGESTTNGNGDNDIHIDNVTIGTAIPAGEWSSVAAESGERLAHLSGLAPETKYEVQVQASCGEEFSESIFFTTLPSCFAPSALIASEISAHTAKLAWTNGAEGQEAWQIMLNGDEEHLIDANANPFVIEDLEAATNYSVKVRANCGDEDGVSAWSAAINFATAEACPVPSALAASNISVHAADLAWNGSVDVASYDIRYRAAEGLNPVFFEGFEDGIGQWTMQDYASSTGVSTDASYIHSGNGAFSFVYNTTPPQYLISPEISSVVDGMKLEFYYKNTSSSWAETFHVGFSSTDNATASFEFGEEITASDQQWHLYSEEIPAGTKYICWKLTSNDKLRLCIDDITIGEPIAAGDWQVASSNEASLSLENLAAGTKYDVQVKSVCSEDEWTEVLNFTTLNNSVSISDAGYATYYNLTDAYIMPEGVVGHVFSVASGLQLAYESGAVVPADVPLVLEGEEGDYVLLAAEGGASTELANQLIGVNEAATIADDAGYLFYVLSLNANNDPASVGFYWMNEGGAGGFDMPAHKAYLKVAKSAEAPAPRFYLFHGENNATWLNNLQGVDGTVKFFHNGHFYIMRDHVIYDATGKRVELKYN